MKPLIVLLSVFVIALLTIRIITKSWNYQQAARFGLSAMLLLSALGHFIYVEGMTMMIPEVIPFKLSIVYATGVLEILFAVALFVPALKVFTAWTIVVFLILILPMNIYAAYYKVDISSATYNGNGLNYLWFRIPLQLLFIFWAYFLTLKKLN